MRFLFFTLAFIPAAVSAQIVFFHFTDGSMQSYALSDIRKLTFVGDEQVLWLNDGTQYTWNVSTIGQYEFDQITGNEHITLGLAQLHVYPNPANAAVTVDTELQQPARLVVDILDMQGRVVRGLFAGDRPAGAQRLHWDAADDSGARVVPGNYLVRLGTPYGSSTKPLVIQ
jgi:hypothetical protein